MAELPFLVVHGALVWKLLWFALVAGTFALGYAIRRRGARRRARARRELLLGEVTSPHAGPVVIRGRVTSGTASTTYNREHASDAPATLVLDCGGEVVEIEGAVHVEEGSSVRARPWPTVTRALAPGDEVIATGVLSQEHAAEDASYREAKVRWRLAAPSVIALAPRVKALPLELAPLLGALLVVGLGSYGTLRAIGSAELHRAERATGTARDGNLPAFGAGELAAALPGTRDRALDALERQLVGFHLAASERASQLQLRLAELRDECPSRILAGQVRLDEALAAARRCGSHDEVVRILALLGKYDEAERALAPDDVSSIATTTHIATGNWKAAARGADARADELARETPSQYRTQRYLASVAGGQRCLAALFRSYGGDPRAFATLTNRGTGAACAIFEAASLPLAEQATAFLRIPRTSLDNPDDGTSAGVDLVADELAYAAGEPRGAMYGGEAISALMFMFDRSRIWLAPFQLETHPTADGALLAMATYEILRGDQASARSYLARTGPSYAHDEIAIGLALRDGSPIADSGHRDHAGHDEAIALRNGVVDDRIEIYLGDDEAAPFRALLARAASGDGRALIEILELDRLQWQAFSIPVLGLLPRITRDRDAVVAALRLFRNDLTSYSMLHLPFSAVSDMISYRDVARLAGDTTDASHWQAIIDRHVEVLRDRRKAVALLFWNE